MVEGFWQRAEELGEIETIQTQLLIPVRVFEPTSRRKMTMAMQQNICTKGTTFARTIVSTSWSYDELQPHTPSHQTTLSAL